MRVFHVFGRKYAGTGGFKVYNKFAFFQRKLQLWTSVIQNLNNETPSKKNFHKKEHD